jgi:hypothetical protein
VSSSNFFELAVAAEMLGYAVMSTPGVVLGDRVVHAVGIPGPDQGGKWVRG